ncbi:MAG: DinB family protein [Thermogemmatispora sp.]|uniref:DinB family protein n=1 Tax=Thermogemmatispora sp. TaxID=1968838 RepID=UPI001A035A99|nr:DinB family protein [Thermogemmatispora sp.]MBE3565018.1 DinB family protein [Thermogemmatispora sp.]
MTEAEQTRPRGRTLTEIYRGWDRYQQLLVEALAPLSEEQLELRAAPQLRSVRQLAAHIAAARAGWFGGVMEIKPEQLLPYTSWNIEAPDGPVTVLIEGLETTWQIIEEQLGQWTLADLETTFSGVWRDEPYSYVCQEIIWHLIEHDLHHGGELFLILGSHGLPTPEL